MKAYERLMRYAEFATASDENSDTCPSTPAQLDFAAALVDELKALGLTDAAVDKNGYVFATIPASEGCESAPVIGFIAHMDVSPEVEDKNVQPRALVYGGGDIVLNEDKQIVLSPDEYPALNGYVGKTLVVTDGTTLLGADDKAGIAEIITAAERLLADNAPRHGRIRIGFTPDEEIGRGADRFDVAAFGAKWAYTIDGGRFGEVDYETFNAASLKVSITGRSTHPGGAKGKMLNASMLALEYDRLLPALDRPEYTCGYQGFFHMTSMSGSVETAELHYIIRDHDYDKLTARCEYARRAADELQSRYPGAKIVAEIKESYRNMREKIEPEFHLIDNAYRAIEALGGKPISSPVRGGTDGSRLSFMGLPCPNLGTGSHNGHSRYEFACAEEMEQCCELIIKLAEMYADVK